jgi:hypothetical protein
MRATTTLIGALVALVVAAPAVAAPFGFFDGLSGGANSATGVVGIHGWALDASGVARVDVHVDDVAVGRADYGFHRPGVAARFPGFPDSNGAGFGFLLDTTRFNNGHHTISVLVTSNNGLKTTLPPRTVEFMNSSHLLVPFGHISFPQSQATLAGVCDLGDPFRRYSVVEGWALDAGIEPDDTGIAWVELLIDGGSFATSWRDCGFHPGTGGFTQCYGLPSLDVEQLYPSLPNAPRARFRFVIDVGALISLGYYTPGHHVISVRAGDIAGHVATVGSVGVTFMCDEFLPNEPSVGFVDVPPGGPIYSGVVAIIGWAIDWEGVSRVDIYVNGELAGTALYGFPRPRVAELFPGYPNSAGPGFGFFLDSTALANGLNDIKAVVVDVLGEETLIGERRITVHNPVNDP